MATISNVKEIAISLPFRFSEYGKIADTTEPTRLWADRVRSAVGTMVGERVMFPRYGSQIPTDVFKNEAEVADKIEGEVNRVFDEYLPNLRLSNVNVQFDESTGVFSADIVYSLPNDTVVSTNVGFASISGNTPLIEEML